MNDRIKELIEDSMKTKRLVADNLALEIADAATAIIDAINNGSKVLICGNGGSASQAQHFAAELIGRFEEERAAFPAISLTADTSNLTAIANDYGFDYVFSRQIEALGARGDVLVCLTTSGKSKNIIQALKEAEKRGITTVCLNGKKGGKINSDINIIVKSENTARIQEAHIMIIHILCKLVEDAVE